MAYRRRFRRGNVLDVHATCGGEQDQRLARCDVVQNGSVKLVHNIGLLFDQQPIDRGVADAHAEDLFGRFSGLIGRAGKLDATGLAALARRHLRFDHAGTDIRCRHRHLRGGDTEHAARNRNGGRV